MSMARRSAMKERTHFLVFYVVFLATVSTAQSQVPIFTKEPSDQVLSVDSTVILECEASAGSLAVVYSWSFDGVPFESSGERMYAQDGTLVFQLTRTNVGKFACLARTSQGTVSSRPANIQIADIAEFNVPQRQTVIATEGSPLVLRCDNYISVGRTSVEWSMYDTTLGRFIPVQQSDAHIFGELDFGLYFPAFRSDQFGSTSQFRCTVSNQDVQTFKHAIFVVTINDSGSSPPFSPLLSEPEDVTVVVGQRVIFQCIPSGSPVPTVEWFSDNPVPGRFRVISTYFVFVTNASLSDSGTYGCRVGGVNYSASLTVIDAPQVALEGSSAHMVTYGDTLNLQCSVTNDRDDVTWVWFSDGVKLVTDTRGDVAAGSLSLRDTVLDDTGFYQCFATNSAGSGVAIATVEVITIPPEFSAGGRLQDQVAFSGDPLNLTCSAYSAPPPTYTWLKDGSPVVPSPGLVVNSGQLFIQNVSSEFTGNYTCMARTTLPENGTVLGEVASSGELRMVGPTFFTSTAGPLVYRQVKDNPRPIVLPCAIEGDEMAIFDITWQKNGAPIPPGTDPPLSPSTNALTLTFDTWSVSDSGVYECVVSTRIKSFNSSIPRVISTVTNLTIASLPAPPTDIRGLLSEDTATQIEISWEYFGDRDFIVSFTVYRQMSGTTSWIFVSTINDASVTSLMDSGVLPFMEYRFRVDATDRNGQEESAYSAYYTTPEAAPTATPTGLSSTLVNNTMLRISWQPPPERNTDRTGRNGIITEYEIQHRVPSSGDDFSITTVDGSVTHVLLLGTQLEVKIACSTSKGQGPFTAARVFDGSDAIPPTVAPFYEAVWFIVVVVVAGLVVMASVVIIVSICCIAGWRRKRSKAYHVPFRGGNEPNFDVYQYEMEKGARLQSVQPVVMYHDGQVTTEDPYHAASSFMGIPEDYRSYPPPPTFYDARGRVASLEWGSPPPFNLTTLGPQRAKSYEWDPRQLQTTPTFFAEWSKPESMQGVVDNRAMTAPQTQWSEGPDEVFSGQQVEVVHIGAQGSDSPSSSMEKPSQSANDDGEDDTGSHTLSFAASSTFV